MAVHNFAVIQLALQISCHKVPPTHRQPALDGERSESAEKRGQHRGAEGLLEFHARDLSTALHTKSRFQRAAALTLVHPDQTY
eukprot:2896182-Pleurochrysis_carterae.AAC.4